MFFSIVVPVYNRPDEIETLLNCLNKQLYKNFEVLVVESGSTIKSDKVVESFHDKLKVRYFFKGNDGQGFSRNYGFERAEGDYFIVLDSDVLLDPDFVQNIYNHLQTNYLDCYGGPDRAHVSFTDIQKAVNYVLTSIYTTGGIRGNKNHVGVFYPRSFNMGFSREVYNATKGYKLPFFGEDIELSARIMSLGYKVGLISEAYVYHQRKKDFSSFYKQMNFFGRSRINIYKLFPDSLKITHFFPLVFTIYTILLGVHFLIHANTAMFGFLPYLLYLIVIFTDSTIKNNSFKIGFLTIQALFVQMFGYGFGFGKDFIKRVIFKIE